MNNLKHLNRLGKWKQERGYQNTSQLHFYDIKPNLALLTAPLLQLSGVIYWRFLNTLEWIQQDGCCWNYILKGLSNQSYWQ